MTPPLHPARTLPFDELLVGLEAAEARGLVRRDTDGPLALFNYTKACQVNRSWDRWTTLARGLVVDTVARQVVATPFAKFFNAGEPLGGGIEEANGTCDADGDEVWLFDKIDGCLIALWWHDGRWRCSSRGRFHSIQAKAAQAMVDALIAQRLDRYLVTGWTYLLELVHPTSLQVVAYDHIALYLIGVIDVTGREWAELTLLERSGLHAWFRAPLCWQGDTRLVGWAQEDCTRLPGSREGYVAFFPESGKRLKLKGAAYRALHRDAGRVRPLGVWERGLENAASDRAQLPLHMAADHERIENALRVRMHAVSDAVQAWVKAQPDPSDLKAIAAALPTSGLPESHHKVVFKLVRQGLGHGFWDAVWAVVRPDGNVLPGYTPSLAMNNLHATEEG